MYITDIDELVGILRTKLKDYLSFVLEDKNLETSSSVLLTMTPTQACHSTLKLTTKL